MKIQSIKTIDNTVYHLDLYSKVDWINDTYSRYGHDDRQCNIKKLKDGSYFVIDYTYQTKLRIYPPFILRIDYY